MITKVYLLSIGINKYQSPKISNLGECRNDVHKFQQTLIDLGLVQEENCLTMLDEEATRSNIIKNFRSHFDKLNDGDIAVLHFSGHGSSEPTSLEFIESGIEHSNGKNENLVPYDSHHSIVYNIADKEMRMLVAQLQCKKKDTSFVSILDCCHSGSALKYDEFRLKACPGRIEPRPLESYLEGQFSEMLAQSKQLTLPPINYISLAACAPHESAWENEDGGLFTNALIAFIKQKEVKITYAELQLLSHLQVRVEKRFQQNPTLEISEGANPFKYFLKNDTSETPYFPLLKKGGTEWYVFLGAIHNLYSNPDSKIPIYRKDGYPNAIGTATIKNVYLEKSTVIPSWLSFPPGATETLYLGIHPNRLPIAIEKQNVSASFSGIFDHFCASEDFKSQFLIEEKSAYKLQIRENELSIYKKEIEDSKRIIGTKEMTKRTIHWLNHQLRMIAKWENILKLHPIKNTKLSFQNISLFFNYWNPNGKKIEASLNTSNDFLQHIEVPLNKEQKGVYYSIDIQHDYHSSDGLYFFLIHLDRKYCIQQKNEEFSKPINRFTKKVLYNSEYNGCLLGISDPSLSLIEDNFVLIASAMPFTNSSYFIQKRIGNQFGKILDSLTLERSNSESVNSSIDMTNQWCIKRLNIQLKFKS